MDQFGPDKRHDLERQIIRLMAIGVGQGNFSQDESQVVARFVLQELPKVHTDVDVSAFLAYLGQRWPIFMSLSTVDSAKTTELHKNEIINATMSKIHSGDIDGALGALKGASI